ncbi:GDSL-type esterase/lipase family protein [bacterium]|nr:GDSL-type esterase/lipase family protein [bacterium]
MTALVNAKHYKLFVLTGQSNSLGTTAGGEADPTSGSDPADAHVPFFWDNVADATTSLGDSGGAWTTLQDQQGGFYPGSATHWGPEIQFARTLYRAGVRDFGIIKASRGGGGNTNWSKSSGGHMYSHVRSTVDAATAALTTAGDTFEIVGFLYLQGESDSGAEAGIADVRLGALVSNLRGDLTNATSMHAVAGGIAAAGGNRDLVRANQADLAMGDTTISYFENLDLLGQLYDGLHFDKPAKLTVGKRFANAFFEAGIVTPDYGKLVFMGDSITQGGLGFPSYRYEVFQHLVDAGATYTFTGSVTGAYQNNSGAIPDYEGEAFSNVHEGHFGWRAFWENGRVPLPSNRRSGNRGEGTVLNWTGQATQYESNSSGNWVAYPDPGASGSGNTGTTYLPDTVVVMIGINDLADGGSASQLRDDIATMIDQLRAANSEVRIFLNHLLHTDQTAALQTKVDVFNGLLQPLADTKNAAVATSPVWVIDASTGFDPVSMTHDEVHPNAIGEVFVGRGIAVGLGLTPKDSVVAPVVYPVVEKEVLGVCFRGDEIYNGSSYINGWSEVSASATSESLTGLILERNHLNGAGEWLEGITSSKDGGVTNWNSGNDGDWTFEIEMKFQANPAGFAIWLGTDSHRIIVDVMGAGTQDTNGDVFNVAHNNLDGEFHKWRIVNDSTMSRYHVWRDGVRLTSVEGAGYDSTGADSRVVLGDRTGGAFGDNYRVEIASICYDQSGGFLPLGADLDGDGMSDAYEYEHFGSVTMALPGANADEDQWSNLEEYLANTDPQDNQSFFSIGGIEEVGGMARVTLNQTSLARNYRLYQSDDLGDLDPWALVVGPVPGNGGSLSLDDTELVKVRSFFRVGVELP